MVSVKVLPGKLQGTIQIPPSKSHTLRSILFAFLAKGKSRIENPLPSPDTMAMIDATRHLGAKIDMEEGALIIDGVSGRPHPAEDVIQCGNSGQVLRFVGAISALSESYTVLTGDPSIRHNRPVLPLIDGLTQLGAFATSTRLDGYAPLLIKGPIRGGKAKIAGFDSQPISGLLMLGAFHALELEVTNPGEQPWVALTLDWFKRLNIPYENHHFERYKMKGGAKIDGFHYRVPGDLSSAAFSLAAAVLSGSELILENIDLQDVQGDKKIIPTLESMGALFEMDGTRLHVKKSAHLKGITIDVNDFIDALPILAVIGCFAEGTTEIVNAKIARNKESDRIACIAKELKKMGANIEEKPDGLLIRKSRLQGVGDLEAHHDHRLAMALIVAAMNAEGESVIHGVRCIAKSYPSFFEDFVNIGAKIS
ncbi:MAG: 3-phosphoshikimate 1-carboxyvinyltransferase [Chlamydiae bacterium RIFCSPHIGHO2_12_FULL_44_59]|nr:MAG: 3-phosphoshikimate 1-carboxyvinyltransferase [Chlamydiae bacterium RIFCSPHIGHO2_01_FULL_44_39]OGN59113.1 MAG: 3-phosphoshikimate 1-carboxyvinyltransferase [Chlamydiae bacterium RIFCSPHIGHO2_02_FULL_45_9]OGN61124.1 MAG: 3-phosphoshikimate 1-carboxyvinyltransferase [Chlamydiae bacterium RIFCSPHIGHO2_12_FULL_44_59]OGN65594.1 MAG: 3-phosphoshikimate 1-carboxyvinyltransferase [Chlamydiae bacterium RIFCSPLOWO2_01_FULL_44_52]OGN68071.1 MAG: 3-phosphoshikimate 1-carboxyvinyltransferase [Chlamyd